MVPGTDEVSIPPVAEITEIAAEVRIAAASVTIGLFCAAIPNAFVIKPLHRHVLKIIGTFRIRDVSPTTVLAFEVA